MRIYKVLRYSMRIAALAGAVIPLLAAPASAQNPQARSPKTRPVSVADLILVNGRVYTVDDSRPMVSAFAVRDGRIVFAGSDREARMLAGPRTRVIDAQGKTVIPGMVDA
ncbi:MAG TPA: hypothetical protein VKO87_02710, partial [Gemmatimonadaceae bacterium]|nr:hypothetical protein [Gemmatimonadaceae bacterium]